MMKYLLFVSVIFLWAGVFTAIGGSPSQGMASVANPADRVELSCASSKANEVASSPKYGTITPKELYQLQKKGKKPVIIDVRTDQEYRTIHVPDAILVPLDKLDVAKVARKYKLKDKTFYLICRSGRRSATAAGKFIDAGIGKPVNVTGGTSQWDKEGYPVIKEHK